MDTKNDVIIILTPDAESAILDIEKKYNLEENDDDAMKIMTEEKPLNINIIVALSRKFIKGEISDEQFTASLQKDLNMKNMDRETSQKIFKDISTSVIPLFKKISEEDIKNRNLPDVNAPNQPTIVEPVRMTSKELPLPKNTYSPGINQNIPSEKVLPTNGTAKQNAPPKKIKEIEKPMPRKTTKGPDEYREEL